MSRWLFAIFLFRAAAFADVVQPLPFSHKPHLAVALRCADCHQNPDPGENVTFPATTKCMTCHVAIAKDKPSIQKLAEFAKAGRPIPWVRVNQIPGYVFFSHRVHLDASQKCQTCHAADAERAVLKMGECMDCHRQN